jgi:hypothetical protein
LGDHHPPPDVMRQLRQEAGFGCCICGKPIIDYHHILGWQRTGNDPDHLMILCTEHHREATNKAISEEEQRAWKARPTNIERGYVDGLLKITERPLVVTTRHVSFVGPFRYVVDGEDILVIEADDAGRMFVTLSLYDEDDNLLCHISRNHWISGDPTPWDIQFGANVLTLRTASHRVPLDINARERFVELHTDLWRHGVKLAFRGMQGPILRSAQGDVKFYMDNVIYCNFDIVVFESGKRVLIRPKPPRAEMAIGKSIDDAIETYRRITNE